MRREIDLDWNPFQLPSDKDVFSVRDQEIAEHRDLIRRNKKTQLQERNCPSLPAMERRSTTSLSMRPQRLDDDTDYSKIGPVRAEHKRRELFSEFVDQKRSILMTQLMINRKCQEVDRIDMEEVTEDNAIEDQVAKNKELENQYRMTMSQYEANLIRGKNARDAAIRKRTMVSERLRWKREAVTTMEKDIELNEDSVRMFRTFSQFLKQIEEDVPHELLVRDPTVLLQEMELLENENLFLIRKCEDIQAIMDRGLSFFGDELKRTNNEADSVNAQTGGLKPEKSTEARGEGVAHDGDRIDGRLNAVTKLVMRTYGECFEKRADVTALMMLERMENQMEDMYRVLETIPADIVHEKEAKMKIEKREEGKRKKREAQAKEAQRKADMAIQRAKEPVKKKVGRPLMQRSLPMGTGISNQSNKNDEGAIQEQLLYGELDD